MALHGKTLLFNLHPHERGSYIMGNNLPAVLRTEMLLRNLPCTFVPRYRKVLKIEEVFRKSLLISVLKSKGQLNIFDENQQQRYASYIYFC